MQSLKLYCITSVSGQTLHFFLPQIIFALNFFCERYNYNRIFHRRYNYLSAANYSCTVGKSPLSPLTAFSVNAKLLSAQLAS